ncbi:helix-turn-helix domain-containing protein [Psychroserpens ponticola]|uniref:AraC family transcriptional regulator n=1 Tax=Psychroserpens ponticola TaxID=2932268 RepID=A0ABY7RZK8_9FLAO|nr:AraC family transcriptional regulator [Psychroserpens ponticola]WCO02591.1 AraC family transcriptional regulator [Psychroserpens ponticola]
MRSNLFSATFFYSRDWSQVTNISYFYTMKFEIDILIILDLFAGFSAIMISLLFLTIKSKNQKANVFLALFALSLGWTEISSIYIDYLEINELKASFFFHLDFVFLIIPSLFIYIIITINKSFNRWYLLLLLPALLINTFQPEEDSFLDFIFILLYPLFVIPLIIIAFRFLRSHSKNVANYYSSELESKTMSWIKSIIILVFIFHITMILSEIAILQSESLGYVFALLGTLITVFIVYWVGYNGFFQAQLFTTTFNIEKTVSNEDDKDVPQSENDESLQEHFQEVCEQIEKEKLFKDQNLTLNALAGLLEIKERDLSVLINKASNTNFYKFINKYRVDEFKKLMQSDKAAQYSILGLAQEAGFSSKSTFYNAFKTLEGITPRQYKESLNASENTNSD